MTCSKNWNNGESELRDIPLGVASAWRCHDQPRGWQLQTTCRPRDRNLAGHTTKSNAIQTSQLLRKVSKKSLQGLGHAVWVTAQMPKNDKKKSRKAEIFPCCWHCLGWSKPKSKKYIDWECLAILPIKVCFWVCSSIVNCPQSFQRNLPQIVHVGHINRDFKMGWSDLGGHWRSGEEQGNRANHILWLSHSQKDAIYLTWQRWQKWLKYLEMTSD